jgi:hypothetical protein
MEAYILHIQNTYTKYESKSINNDGQTLTNKLEKPEIVTSDVYSAWCTEKQAQKEAARILLQSCEKYYLSDSLFHDFSLPALRQAVAALINADFVKEAVRLINEYDFSNTPSKMTIKIRVIKSTFKGSAFE